MFSLFVCCEYWLVKLFKGITVNFLLFEMWKALFGMCVCNICLHFTDLRNYGSERLMICAYTRQSIT